ncbi:hypothetical protein ACTFIW_000926 [Dictyostelium discoideum]
MNYFQQTFETCSLISSIIIVFNYDRNREKDSLKCVQDGGEEKEKEKIKKNIALVNEKEIEKVTGSPLPCKSSNGETSTSHEAEDEDVGADDDEGVKGGDDE